MKDIIDKTFDLAAKIPCEKMTISDICKNAKISKSTFYKHFKSKEELFSFLYTSIDYKLLQALPIILVSDASPLYKYWSTWRFYIDRTVAAGPEVIEYVMKSGFVKKPHTFFYKENLSITTARIKLLELCQDMKIIREDISAAILHDLYHYFLVGFNVDWSNRRAPVEYKQAVFEGMMNIFSATPDFASEDTLAVSLRF